MIAFGIGSLIMGRLADRFGVRSLPWSALEDVDADGTVWRRWATCPTTGDPVLALFSDDIPSDETT